MTPESGFPPFSCRVPSSRPQRVISPKALLPGLPAAKMEILCGYLRNTDVHRRFRDGTVYASADEVRHRT